MTTLTCRRRTWQSPLFAFVTTCALTVHSIMMAIPADATSAKQPAGMTLKVVSCPTTYVATKTKGSVQGTERVTGLPKSLQGRVQLYTDANRTLPALLGPVGWTCSASIFQDGSATFSIIPRGSSSTRSAFSEGIGASSQGGCAGCASGVACQYFSSADEQLPNSPCSASLPKTELIHYVSGSSSADSGTVEITIPPPKGKHNQLYEVLRYNKNGGEEEDDETCTLPSRDLTLCKAITAQFVAQNWLFSAPTMNRNTTTTTSTPAVTGPSVQQVAQAVQSALMNGQVPGAAAIPDAVVTCGPPNVSLTPGSYLGCDFNSASVGGVAAVLQIAGSSPSDFTVVAISSANVCTGLPTAAVQAEDAWDSYQGLPNC